jgi:hypothetical protein
VRCSPCWTATLSACIACSTKTLPSGHPAHTQRLRSAAGVAADVRADNQTSALSDYETSGNAGILFRR